MSERERDRGATRLGQDIVGKRLVVERGPDASAERRRGTDAVHRPPRRSSRFRRVRHNDYSGLRDIGTRRRPR